MSDLTSLKVPRLVRDRLAAVAKARGVSMRIVMDELSLQAADDALMDLAARQMTVLRDTEPAAWEDYIAEG